MENLALRVWGIAWSLLLLALFPLTAWAQTRLSVPHVEYGIASWYGKKFHGRRTANGEVYDMFRLTAAHKSAPLGMSAIVTNLDNGRSVRVRINDRGPFIGERILDLSYAAAHRLGMVDAGLARVRIRFLPDTIPILTFLVQAGAYRDAANAARVRQLLTSYHPNVWITRAREAARLFYRVRLGTFTSRAAAERVARRIRALGYEASVVPHLQPAPAQGRDARS